MSKGVLHLGNRVQSGRNGNVLQEEFTLPLDSLLQKRFVLAKTGAGKSTTAADFVEELLDHKVQNIVLDPKGDRYGFRASADGKSEGYPMHVLGGIHGDLPLNHLAGEAIGRWLGEDSSVSAVLDLSEFKKGQLYRFVADFSESFYETKRRNNTPVHLLFEEIHEVCPQDKTNIYGPDLFRCIESISAIFSKGRFIGIGPTATSQRSARVNKNVLTQADMLIAMRITHPLDVKTVDEWLKYQGDQGKRALLLGEIQGLPTGQAYVYAPELDVFQKVMFRRTRTFDGGQTPKLGEKRPEPKVLAKVDLERIRGEMASVVEEIKANDPVNLKRLLAAKEKELEALRKAKEPKPSPPAKEIVKRERVEVVAWTERDEQQFRARLKDGYALVERIGKAAASLDRLLDNHRHRFELFSEKDDWGRTPAQQGYGVRVRQHSGVASGDHARSPTQVPDKPIGGIQVTTRRPPAQVTIAAPAMREASASVALDGDTQSFALTPYQQDLLDAMAWLKSVGQANPTVGTIGVVAEKSHTSSTFDEYLRILGKEGFIQRQGEVVRLTAKGEAAANAPDAPRDVQQMQEAIYRRLTPYQAKLLRALVGVHPDSLQRLELAEKSQTSATSSTFDEYLRQLKNFGLVEVDPEHGGYRASSILFLEA